MCGPRYWLALPLVLAVAVADDRTTCGRATDEIEWSFSSVGETPCAMWWAVTAKCFPGWPLEKLPDHPRSQHYLHSNDPCSCSSLSYNLMAACTWCQYEDFSSNWVTEKVWFANCTASRQPIEPLNVILGRSFPLWASVSNHGTRPSDTLKSIPSSHASTSVKPIASQTRVPPQGRSTTPPLPALATSGGQLSTALAHQSSGHSLGYPAVQTSDQTSEDKTEDKTRRSDPLHVNIIAVAAAGAVLGILLLLGLACWVRRRRTSGISPFRPADISVPVRSSTTSLELLSAAGYAALEDARDPPPIYSPATGNLSMRLK